MRSARRRCTSSNGIWGLLAAGIFAAGLPITQGWNGMDRPVTGLLYGNGTQILAQLIEVVAIIVFVGATSYAFFWVLKASDLLRSRTSDELIGLDLSEMGVQGYGDDSVEAIAPMPQLAPPTPARGPQRMPWELANEAARPSSANRPPPAPAADADTPFFTESGKPRRKDGNDGRDARRQQGNNNPSSKK